MKVRGHPECDLMIIIKTDKSHFYFFSPSLCFEEKLCHQALKMDEKVFGTSLFIGKFTR